MLPKLHIIFEHWKYNKQFDVYVSNLGNILDKNKQKKKTFVTSDGYMVIRCKKKCVSIHRLVMLTFHPIIDAENYTVDHLNHNKRDNSVKNLEWVTAQENLERAKRDFIHICNRNKQIKTEPKNKKSKKSLPKSIIITNNTTKNSITIKADYNPYLLESILNKYFIEQKVVMPYVSAKKIIKQIFNGTNSDGHKKYYGYYFEAIYNS